MSLTPPPQASSTSSPAGSSGSTPTDPSVLASEGPAPTLQPTTIDVVAFRATDDGKALAAWIRSEFDKAKTARKSHEQQWYIQMSYYLGNQWVKPMPTSTPVGMDRKLSREPIGAGKTRRTVNRVRSFVRWELSKFISQQPSIVAVPGTGEDEDIRASIAAEQVWTSISSSKNLRKQFARAARWMILTGNGFIKTEWDPTAVTVDGQQGDLKYSAITPFHLFVPDLREEEIEGQPFIILAYTKSKLWVEQTYAKELAGAKITGTSTSSASLIDDAYLNLQKANDQDVVLMFEVWMKPGAHPLYPQGGMAIMVENTLLTVYPDGMPYNHGQYPITQFQHLGTGSFYGDSPLVDLVQLQKEYNQLRTDISDTARKMANPQLMAYQGSIVPSKITNQAGQVILVRQGMSMPTPLPLQSIPSYALQQQDRVLQDWTDISGIQDVTTGSAPGGVSAGTALSYLQEAANSYHTPQFQEIEFGHEKIANQTLALFVQMVDVPRKLQIVGADGSFDVAQLSGAGVMNGTDLRVEANSSAPTSQSAVRAFAMDLFSVGAIQQPDLLNMLDMNSFQRMLDTQKVAVRKAQRENVEMKKLDPAHIDQAAQMAGQQLLQQAQEPGFGLDPATGQMDPEIQGQVQAAMSGQAQAPLMVAVADFDDHATHIQYHNAFCMTPEWEMLPQELQDQFRMHVMVHQHYLQQAQLQQFMAQIPGDGTEPGAEPKPGGDAKSGASSSEADYLQQQAQEHGQQASNQDNGIGA